MSTNQKQPLQDRGAKLISASIIAVAGGIMLAVGEREVGGLAAGVGAIVLMFGFAAWITTWFRRNE